MSTGITESTEQFLLGGGEMGKLIRTMDWSETPLGAIETWPQSLRTSVSLCLSSSFPILIAWGPEKIQIYNDSYRPICGAKHPESMGMNFRICWETALDVVGDAFTKAEEVGEGTYINDQRMFLDRYGYLEEAFMTFSFAPIRDESGGVGGIFHPITETTVKILGARRTHALRELGAALGKAKSIEDISFITVDKYNDYQLDIPFMAFYQFSPDRRVVARLSAAGIDSVDDLCPQEIDLSLSDPWSMATVLTTGSYQEVTGLAQRFGVFPCGPYPETPRSALVLPLRVSGQEEMFGFLVAGVSSRRSLDEEYLNFYDQLTNTYNTALSSVYSYEQEQKRAEALAEIDRSKTAFFSNVSHEFRTPLTLMLGPLEDMLSGSALPESMKGSLASVQRNTERLLKLVNNLLDYSRVEAGRMQAAYQQVDLSELTLDLSSSFRSIIEKAGMTLLVHCTSLRQDTYVDKQMWEKIVLNLLSNAFKYTMAGTIEVQLLQEGDYAVLHVIDTGVGIPEKELPHMFERFHRVENAAGRTHEGTGIGLSLVQELVTLHSGHISVESVEGEGSTFTVRIPFGKSHLPTDKILQEDRFQDSSAIKSAFLQEAISLLPAESATDLPKRIIPAAHASQGFDAQEDQETKILIVDDNADMRAYLKRLIHPYFDTLTAINGADALSKIAIFKPDLVLSDIMMPIMSGKDLLEAIRSNVETIRLPVIFLSARAGEEARIDGLEAGANDYLVKPFSAAELLTKIRAQIKITRARNHAEQQLQRLVLNAPVAIAMYRGPRHIIEIANYRMLTYWGRSEGETVGEELFKVLPELEAQGLRTIMDSVYRSGERFVNDKMPIVLSRYGKEEITYINLTIEALVEPDGRISGVMAVAADVTALAVANNEVEKAADTLSLALDAANLGIWKTDWGTDSLELSPTARAMHGLSPAQAVSFSATLSLVKPEHRDRFLSAVTAAAQTKGRFSEEYQVVPFDGTKSKWIHSTGKTQVDAAGNVISVIGTLRDITEQKEDDQRKSDFISMVSHEMKTPLTSISAFTQVLRAHVGKNGDTYAGDKLDRIYGQVKKMSKLISGFLDISRLRESGKIHLMKSTYNLHDLIKEIVQDLEDSAATHEVLLSAAGDVEMYGDRDKIGSVVMNLLTNAIKYSPGKKQVQLATRVSENRVFISCSDHGIGIKPQDINRLFDRFYRVDDTQINKIGGFGIGLYVCAEIVKKHGGEIWAESTYGVGSTFHVALPLVVSV